MVVLKRTEVCWFEGGGGLSRAGDGGSCGLLLSSLLSWDGSFLSWFVLNFFLHWSGLSFFLEGL